MSKNHQYALDRPEIDAMFERLKAELAKQPLPTEHGKPRLAHASEFMLMHKDGDTGTYGFKHCDSRNYVFLLPHGDGTFELYVPLSKEPFMRGTFDAYPPFNPDKEGAKP